MDLYLKGKRVLLRSVGLEPAALSERAQLVALVRMVPFVERNYNMVELGLSVTRDMSGLCTR